MKKILRKAADEDYEAFRVLQTERYYGDDRDARAMIDMMWSIRDSEDMCIYTIQPEDVPAGFIVVSNPLGSMPNVGIDVIDRFQNRGLATEALRQLPCMRYKFETAEDNDPANRVAGKLGMKVLGEENIEGYRFIIWHMTEQCEV